MRIRKLSSMFGYILSMTLPVAIGEAACGGSGTNGTNTTTGDGGGSDGDADSGNNVNQCGKCGCNIPPLPPEKTFAWTPDCNDAGADDGGADADVDAAPDGSANVDDKQCLYMRCETLCGPVPAGSGNVHARCEIVADAGPLSVHCAFERICGRRPAGLIDPTDAASQDPIAHYLASSAFLEAASVDAFAILADDLRAHGAPARLVRAAERAARDEVRHARVMAAFANRAGASVVSPCAAPRTPRSLEAIAIENAQEGCVRETYGALLATWQASTARDARFRAAMRRIARDETRHAELAWAVARWADARLSSAARARVEKARRTAVDGLVAELQGEPARDLVESLGFPRAREARATAEALDALLWQHAA